MKIVITSTSQIDIPPDKLRKFKHEFISNKTASVYYNPTPPHLLSEYKPEFIVAAIKEILIENGTLVVHIEEFTNNINNSRSVMEQLKNKRLIPNIIYNNSELFGIWLLPP